MVYKFFSTAVTYPLLFAIGVSMTPWDKLMAAFNLPEHSHDLLYCGDIDGHRRVRRSIAWHVPDRVAIINACHSGRGNRRRRHLTAANRMPLMPFAQIATRIGGAVTVTTVLVLLSRLV